MSSIRHIDISGIEVPALHFVDGEWIESQTTFSVWSPLDWTERLGEVSLGALDVGEAAIEAGRRAASVWGALGTGRSQLLHDLADQVELMGDEIATVEATDSGILAGETAAHLVPAAAGHLRTFADLATADETAAPVTRRVPAGVSVILSTWRSPFLSAVYAASAALAAGNTVVIKPNEWTPLSTALLGLAAERAALPPGVLNIVQGVTEAVGDSLVTSLEIDRLTMTGSLVSARNNAVMAARNLHEYRIEVAALPTAIALNDADVVQVARDAAAHYARSDPGTLGGVRVLVVRELASDLTDALTKEMRELVAGDSRHIETTSPPMIHPQALTRLHALVDRCRADGDRILAGGNPVEGPGLQFEPTLIRPQSLNSEAVTTEIFGPVVTIEVVDADHGAVAIANSATVPVVASIYTSDVERASIVADELDCRLVRRNGPPTSEALDPVPGSRTVADLLDFHSRSKTVGVTQASGELVDISADLETA